MSATTDIKALLTGIESNIFRGEMPDTPDNCCCIYDTGGISPERNFRSIAYEQPTIQIKVRDVAYDLGYSRCEAIKDALNGKTNQTVNGHFYLGIFQEGDIFSLGKDEKKRTVFTVNFRLKVKRSG